MGTHVIARDEIGAHNVTLTASEVETFTFGEDLQSVDVISDGAAAVYFTLDGSEPTVEGANCYVIPGGFSGVDTRQPRTAQATVVKAISAGTPTVSVQRGD